MGFVGDIFEGIGDILGDIWEGIEDIGSSIDDFVNDVIPGGWLGVGGAALLAVGIYNPTLLGLADAGALSEAALAAEGIDAAALAAEIGTAVSEGSLLSAGVGLPSTLAELAVPELITGGSLSAMMPTAAGISSALGSVLPVALTPTAATLTAMGTGALTGMATNAGLSLLTGNDITLKGLVTSAATGGIAGGIGSAFLPAADSFTQAALNGAATSAGSGAIMNVIQGNDLTDNLLENAALGGVIGGSMYGIGQAYDKLFPTEPVAPQVTDAEFIAQDADQLFQQGLGADQIEQTLIASGVDPAVASHAAQLATNNIGANGITNVLNNTYGNTDLFLKPGTTVGEYTPAEQASLDKLIADQSAKYPMDATGAPLDLAPNQTQNVEGNIVTTYDDGSTLTTDVNGNVIGSTNAPVIPTPTPPGTLSDTANAIANGAAAAGAGTITSGQLAPQNTTINWYAGQSPWKWGSVAGPQIGVNGVPMNVQPMYNGTPIQAQYYWGEHPDATNWNNVPDAPATPWGAEYSAVGGNQYLNIPAFTQNMLGQYPSTPTVPGQA